MIQERLPDEVVVVSVSLKESQKLNRLYRKKDRPTNVLSFFYDIPLLSSPRKRGSKEIKKNTQSYGEIIVCPTVIRAEAKKAGNSYQYQMTWMIVHGMIHLAGVHHERSPMAEKKSEAVEQRVLADIFSR